MTRIRVGTRVREVDADPDDSPLGEVVRAAPGEALDDIPGDERRVTVRWEEETFFRHDIWRQRRYVGDLVVVSPTAPDPERRPAMPLIGREVYRLPECPV